MSDSSPPHWIRRAVPSDAPEIARLLTELGHPATKGDVEGRWSAWTAAGNSALVAEGADGALAGVATLHRMHVLHRAVVVGRITALVVDSRLRGTGVGRALVSASEEALADEGCGLIEITSNDRLVAAHAFYLRLGYERSSMRFVKTLTTTKP